MKKKKNPISIESAGYGYGCSWKWNIIWTLKERQCASMISLNNNNNSLDDLHVITFSLPMNREREGEKKKKSI